MRDVLAQVAGRDVSRETFDKVEAYVEILRVEARRQNLISDSTIENLWDRHILDSAQILRFETHQDASWVDIGSGAGLPGVIISILTKAQVTLIEPRRLRADFLARVIEELGLADRVTIVASKAEKAQGRFDMITARAVASLDKLLKISTHLSTRKSRWVLPKGQRAQSELAEARRNWQCEAEIVPSCTDPTSGILLLRDVKAKGGR